MAKSSGKDVSLQALLIADSFAAAFKPFNKSQALVDFCGLKCIDYALELLSRTDVKEVIVASAKDTDEIERHLKKTWSRRQTPFQIHHLKCTECVSFGDVMRDVDKKSLIKSDFILMHCSSVANCDLKQAVSEHRTRRMRDKNCVLTLVYSSASPGSNCCSVDENVFVMFHSASNRLLSYKNLGNENGDATVPIDTLLGNETVCSRFDLVDCQIAVCSPQVPPLFSDNFDFESRRDLLREILTNDEILGYSAHVHVLDGVACSFNSCEAYLSASLMMLQRYFYPLTPDTFARTAGFSPYTLFKRDVYLPANVRLAKESVTKKNVLIGDRCRIEHNCMLENCILGSDCTIGEGSVLKNCILWDGVTIGQNCHVDTSLLCSSVDIADGVRLSHRCILYNGVTLNANVSLPPGTALSCATFDDHELTSQAAPNGWSGQKLFTLHSSRDNCPLWTQSSTFRLKNESLFEQPKNCTNTNEETELVEQLSAAKIATQEQDIFSDSDSDGEDSFYQVLLDILQRGLDEKIDCDNLILEINCAKPTFNVGVEKFSRLLISAVVDLSEEQGGKSVANVLKHFLPLIKNYFKSPESQLHCLRQLQHSCTTRLFLTSQLANILHYLYEADVLEEESILSWAKTLNTSEAALIAPFTSWLLQADEESSEDADAD